MSIEFNPENLDLYNELRDVPNIAKKAITAGRLKGMTDINPMYRIKALTEAFGPCGIGWWYTIERRWMESAGEHAQEVAAFVEIMLYYKLNGVVSQGIPGTGGSMFAANESKGIHVSDECYKMALTDAISVAAKALGVGADVYWATDAVSTKYSPVEENRNFIPASSPLVCTECGQLIADAESDGKKFSASQIASAGVKRFGRPVCFDCARKLKNEN